MKRTINRYRAFFKRYGIISGLLIICFSLEAQKIEGAIEWAKCIGSKES